MNARVEVIARLGDTVLEVAHLGPGTVFRIGTAPGVELASTIATRFSLVEVGATTAIVRRPRGVSGRVIDDVRASEMAGEEVPLAPGMRVELALGLVTVEVGLVDDIRAAVPRPPIERRPYVYGLAALVTHVAAWTASVVLAPYHDKIAHKPRRPVHVKRIASAEVTTVQPIEISMVPTQAPAQGPELAPIARARAEADTMDGLALGFGTLTDTKALRTAMENLGPVYNEKTAGGFGTGRRFDPQADPEFSTIKTGRYATVAHGHGAGEYYDLKAAAHPVIALCESEDCVVTGGNDAATVRQQLEDRTDALVWCYRQHGGSGVEGNVVLELVIAPDGSVHDAHGRGLGAVGACVATVAAEIEFPSADSETRVRYPMTFRPT